MKSEDVFLRHFESIGSGDMTRILADYADDAVAVDSDGIGSGHDHIRESYERNLPKFVSLDMETNVQTLGEYVYVAWRAIGSDGRTLVGSDTFVIRNGLIQLHSFFATTVAEQQSDA